jgi:hypothetical protein
VWTNDGYKITHSRCKQRSDQRAIAFLVPAEGGFVARLGEYLEKVKSDLNAFTGRVWWTGTKGQRLKNCGMGKNTAGKVPHDDARRLKLDNPSDYTFHSYRRTSATTAANGGMTSEQLQGFFGWKSASMCQEYISTSRPAIMHAAQTLGSFDFSEPEVEVEVAVAEEELNLSDFVMEEDAEMCAAAGIPVSGPSTVPNSVDFQKD